MGNPKQKWTSEEEEALRAGVAKHGAGKWKLIQRDPEFNKLLFARSNIDLKDKWRNLNVASGQGPRDKSKTTKAKANPSEAPATPLPAAQTSASVVLSSQDASVDVVMLESRQLPDGINAAKYNEMIFEALSTLKEPNGSDSGAIANFIEQRHSMPQNFKRALSSRLRMLVQQDKLEKKLFLKLISGSIDAAEGLLNLKKLDAQWITPAVTVQNCYKIKNGAPLETKSPTPRPKEPQRRPVQSIAYVGDTVEEAAESAAYKIAEAENKSFVAAEAMKEAERVARMAEEMEALLQFALDCYDQCADGGIVLIN